jgi:SAM-dependent methyltransferase
MRGETRPDRASSSGHYDRYPYEVGVDGGEVYLSTTSPLGRFLAEVSGGVALDVGCGPGNILPALASRVDLAVGIDASEVSVGLARERCAGLPARLMVGDALHLPVGDASADVVLASGSLHHTGNAQRGFRELARVLAPGGRAYLSLYRAGSYYAWLYGSVGALARISARRRLTDRLVNRSLLLPLFALYFWGGRAVVHRRMAPPRYGHLLNYFADQLLNPVVSFHSEAELRRWAGDEGLTVDHLTVSHAGALLNVTLRRRA